MKNDLRYFQLIPMVQAVLDTLQEGIGSEEADAAELAERADVVRELQSTMAAALLDTSRNHAIRALELRGRRAALLAEYGLEPD